ncbi:hypothetical protein V8G54_004660 [Vigna mungo]|uniref:Uncharacterized protein n=1 Tax=Vigna mungo TaxID=3915 RepID=A0AAQ3SFH7_VIGMU
MFSFYSFHTGQTQVVLFMTAVASLSSLVQKPSLKVHPDNGLEVRLSGSADKGKPPTTLSPSMLIVDWRCEVARDTPYEVNITIPVEGYEPIQFVLTKQCVLLIVADYTQDPGGGRTRGWAIFGVLLVELGMATHAQKMSIVPLAVKPPGNVLLLPHKVHGNHQKENMVPFESLKLLLYDDKRAKESGHSCS